MKKERSDDKHYTSTEVGALVESFRNDISVIAEGVQELTERMDHVEIRLEHIENRLIVCEDAIRISMPDLYKRVTRLETKVGI